MLYLLCNRRCSLLGEGTGLGAPESNAGDDFHFWWAASRALVLIRPGTVSRLLAVEGLPSIDDPGDQYEVVDVAEYLGGVTFDDATGVLVSQLKYSTRHPGRPWTVAQICRKRGRRRSGGPSGRPRSVIADLAGTHRRLVEQYGRDAVLSKVRIRLVSNQPADSTLSAAIAAAARWVRDQGRLVRRADMLKALPEEHAKAVQALVTAIGDGLTSTAFCDFLTVLDLSLLGALNRTALAREVRADMVAMSPGQGLDPSWRLFHLVREQAMPESRRQGITAHDVLAALGVGELSDLYPAPARFVELPDPLPAPGTSRLAQVIAAHCGEIVVARGAAGAGKTTAVRQVAAHLPAGSVVVLYDCYGAGEYLNSGEERHTPQRFVMQVTNDLAQLCGTPLLLHPPPLQEDLWRHFIRTLTRTAATLARDAVLVVAVDAADNAAVAAVERSESSFLDGLLSVALPREVCVVVTARSHRVEMTGAAGTPTVDVAPFDPATSAAHLRRYRDDVSPADAAVFHERSGGNPRSQFYVLEQGRRDCWELPRLLEACTRTPDGLFADLVDSALAGRRADGRRWLAALLALSRPVSIRTLARALEVETAAVSAFAEGLTPGVEVAGERLQFRDEDFETYVRGRVDPADVVAAHVRLAELLYLLRAEDPDAAAHVADHQFAAGRYDDLLGMVLAEDAPVGIADGFRREQVQGRRLDLAALAAATTDDGAVAVRVAARACDTASRLNTLSELVETHLDLVARYTDVDLLRSHALKRDHGQWLGPAHMRLAAVLARDPQRAASAREALCDAEAWVRRWMAARDGEARDWRLDPDDVAAAAEAYFHLDGVEAANRWLRRWRPLRFAYAAAADLAARVAGRLGPGAMLHALRTAAAPVAVHAPFLAHAASPTAAPDAEWLAATVAALTSSQSSFRPGPGDHQEPMPPWHARLLDTVLRHGRPGDALALTRRWADALPTHRWEFQGRGSPGLHRLRCHAALAALRGEDLDVDTLVPASLRPGTAENGRPHDPRERDRTMWLGVVCRLGASAVLAARAILGHPVRDTVVEEITTGLDGRLDAADHRWFKRDDSFHGWAALVAEAAVDAGVAPDLLDRLADAAATLLRASAPQLWLDLAELLTERGVHGDRAVDLCVRAAAATRAGVLPAPERVELLTRAAGIATAITPELGSRLFAYAVDAATGINDDAARLLAVHADLAGRATIAADQRATIGERLVRAAEDVAPHVTDSRMVPYATIAAAAAGLDAEVGLSAVSRWDDEDRIRWPSTLSATVIGAVDGAQMSVDDALVLDHLLDDDDTRLRFQLSVAQRLLAGPGGLAAARLALDRAGRWLRHHVAAQSQPGLAQMLLSWARARGLDTAMRAELEAVIALAVPDSSAVPRAGISDWGPTGLPAHLQAMLDEPGTRSWATLRDDVDQLDTAHVYGERMRRFVLAVAGSAAPLERVDVLAEVAEFQGPDTALPVLAELVERWRDWPGLIEWMTDALPDLIMRWLPTLAWRDDTDSLLGQFRALADDAAVRRAVLQALPAARARLTAYGWQNIATLLGGLCRPTDAADALVGLLDDRRTGEQRTVEHTDPADGASPSPSQPMVMLLWSAFAHPRREVRWRACHAARELCLRSNPARAAALVAALVSLIGRAHPGHYRDRALHFYPLSADAALLTTLARLAADRPDLLAPHTTTLARIATSRDLPHVQIRELARQAALAAAAGQATVAEQLAWANRPLACRVDRRPYSYPDRQVSDDRRYRFDQMDTIPYWYSPLARVFGVPVDVIAERAERWILDRWGGSEDDWMTDTRELRDERSYDRTSNGHGAIPPEENLRLYLEYHAMLTAAGELLDEGHPACSEHWDDGAEDLWQSWLREHLPAMADRWLAELRSPVPTHPELFGNLPPLDEWQDPPQADYDRVLGLVDGRLPDQVLVDEHITLRRRDRYAHTYVYSALVGPAHAGDLQRALGAATWASDCKLPDEGEEEFEVDHGTFILRGWIRRPYAPWETLDQHDAYAHELRPAVPLPGRDFRSTIAVVSDRAETTLLGPTWAVAARAEQWSDPRGDDQHTVATSGTRVLVDRASLLRYLKITGTSLIVEVQLGRHRQQRDTSGYNPPRSRIYLVDSDGNVTRG